MTSRESHLLAAFSGRPGFGNSPDRCRVNRKLLRVLSSPSPLLFPEAYIDGSVREDCAEKFNSHGFQGYSTSSQNHSFGGGFEYWSLCDWTTYNQLFLPGQAPFLLNSGVRQMLPCVPKK